MFEIITFDLTGRASLDRCEHVLGPRGQEGHVLVGALARTLSHSPADFSFDCQMDGVPRITIVWQAIFPTAAYAQFLLGGERGELGSTALFLSGLHAMSDEAVIGSTQDMLGGAAPLSGNVFGTVRAHRKPLAANIVSVGDPLKCKAIQIANAAMGRAFFERHLRMPATEHAEHVAGVA